jgi:hypothetical protein
VLFQTVYIWRVYELGSAHSLSVESQQWLHNATEVSGVYGLGNGNSWVYSDSAQMFKERCWNISVAKCPTFCNSSPMCSSLRPACNRKNLCIAKNASADMSVMQQRVHNGDADPRVVVAVELNREGRCASRWTFSDTHGSPSEVLHLKWFSGGFYRL